jgi:hypothetical protein
MEENRKRKSSDNNISNNKKKKIDDLNYENLSSFDGKKHLEIFNKYINLLNETNDKINIILSNKIKDNITDSNPNIKNTQIDIKHLQHNIKYNKHQLNKLIKSMDKISNQLESCHHNLCDHNLYSVLEYHNDRYYYCKKCSYTR